MTPYLAAIKLKKIISLLFENWVQLDTRKSKEISLELGTILPVFATLESGVMVAVNR